MPTEYAVTADDATIPAAVPDSTTDPYIRGGNLGAEAIPFPTPGLEGYVGYRTFSNGDKTFVEWGVWVPEGAVTTEGIGRTLFVRYIRDSTGLPEEAEILNTDSGDALGYPADTGATRQSDSDPRHPTGWLFYRGPETGAFPPSIRARYNSAGSAVEIEGGYPTHWWWDPDLVIGGGMHVGYVALG